MTAERWNVAELRDQLKRWKRYKSSTETRWGRATSDPVRFLNTATDSELQAFLDYYGTAAEIEKRFNVVFEVFTTIPRTGLEPDRKREIADALGDLGHHLNYELRDVVERAEAILHERGWRYERDAEVWRNDVRHPRTVPPGTAKALDAPNRPEELFGRAVRDRCRTSGVTRNTSDVRKRIADALASTFPPELTDPRYRGPIWQAVRNYLKTLRT